MTSSALVYINPAAHAWRYPPPKQLTVHNVQSESPVQAFHRLLPNYAETPLHSLPSVAKHLGLGHVFVKDESQRFGLPSFKILGASWAVYRAVAERLGLDALALLTEQGPSFDLSSMGVLAREQGLRLRLVTCTEGNWGRAVARMASYLGVPVTVYVPAHMHEGTREKIRGEGADVKVVDGDYDVAVAAAQGAAETDGSLLVMDISWEGYETVPQWVVEGYQTMLDESDTQVLRMAEGKTITHVVVPAGCGSIAQAVAQHFKSTVREQSAGPAATVLSVEPDTAACLKTSLERGKMTGVPTKDSIMCGMNCGTLSTTAWPVLRSGVDGAVVVRDAEAHRGVETLQELGVNAGPCGAATLAALNRACEGEKARSGLSDESVVVLYCTEGAREYAVPI